MPLCLRTAMATSGWCWSLTVTTAMHLPRRGAPGRIAKRAGLRSPIGKPTSGAGGNGGDKEIWQLIMIFGLRPRPWTKPRSCRKLVVGQALDGAAREIISIVRNTKFHGNSLLAVLLFATLIAGCSGGSDLMSRDAEWFSRPGRLFIRNISIDAPPLTPNKLVATEDLVSAEGFCPGMAPPEGSPVDANAATDGASAARPPSTTGTVALGHTECDVVRGIGAPASVNLSNNGRGDRVAVINYVQGQRAGIYTFTAGRLSSIERGPEQPAPPKTAKSSKPKKKPAAT